VTTFLADTFEKLASDSTWPHEYKNIGRLKFQMARLALMVVEEKLISEQEHAKLTQHFRTGLKIVLKNEGINESDYANVKKKRALGYWPTRRTNSEQSRKT